MLKDSRDFVGLIEWRQLVKKTKTKTKKTKKNGDSQSPMGKQNKFHRKQINGLVQDCSNSSALTMELLQSCTKPLRCKFVVITVSANGLVMLGTRTSAGTVMTKAAHVRNHHFEDWEAFLHLCYFKTAAVFAKTFSLSSWHFMYWNHLSVLRWRR